MNAHDKVNILLVDDQPAKLLSYEAILSELGENLIKASSGARGAGAPAQDRHRGRPDGRLHAGARRLRAGGDDPPASALPEDGDHLRLGRPPDRPRPAQGLRVGRGGLRLGAGRAGAPARQGQRLRRALPQDARARAAEPRARAARRRAHRGAARPSIARQIELRRAAARGRPPQGRVPGAARPRAAQPAGADPQRGRASCA